MLIAAINGFLAVAAGAFAAHALQSRLDSHAMQVFETGARYQMYHALAIGLAAFAMRDAAGSSAQVAACAVSCRDRAVLRLALCCWRYRRAPVRVGDAIRRAWLLLPAGPRSDGPHSDPMLTILEICK